MLALLEAARLRRSPFDAGAEREQAPRNANGGAVGLGWMRTHAHGDRIVWHNGATGGFRSFIGYSEVSGRAVLLMANGQIELDSLGVHLVNPAFASEPTRAPRRSGWIGALIAGLALAGLAWRAWRPQARFQQALEVVMAAAMLALAWRLSSAASAAWLAAAAGVALALACGMLWRGRSMPLWPGSRRRLLLAMFNAAGGLVLVFWLW